MKLVIDEQLSRLERKMGLVNPLERAGKVVQVTGLVVECEGPDVSLGDVVTIQSNRRDLNTTAEVVGFRDNRVLVMPLEEISEIHAGCRVVSAVQGHQVPTGESLRGRVLNGLGKPIDGKGPLGCEYVGGGQFKAPNPMDRPPIDEPFQTGVRSIDSFTPMGRGQRVGIFAGSGVGKSTLLGMIARGGDADVNVIALVGERGRELREFIENDLGPEGLAKSVLIISTSDQPAPMRIRAAFLASRVAESFRDQGKQVLFLMDSVTRLAMAQREIGLAIGEPPATRGYTPSVFAMLPRLLERSGLNAQGAITALYTVLVEGDDMNEPVADAVRGILDGHIVLSRELATANHFPSIDVLESVSRLVRSVLSTEDVSLVSRARDLLAVHRKNEDLINIGAYSRGSNPKIDEAIARYDALMAFLKQPHDEMAGRMESLEALKKILA